MRCDFLIFVFRDNQVEAFAKSFRIVKISTVSSTEMFRSIRVTEVVLDRRTDVHNHIITTVTLYAMRLKSGSGKSVAEKPS